MGIIMFISEFLKNGQMDQNLNARNRQTRAHEHHGDDKISVLESFPVQKDKPLALFISMLSVCPLASALETVDLFSQ